MIEETLGRFLKNPLQVFMGKLLEGLVRELALKLYDAFLPEKSLEYFLEK